MGITANEKTNTWSEEAKPEPDIVTRGSGVVRGESQHVGNQQERDDRTSSTRSSIFSAGTGITGGMLDHLIDEYLDQMAAKEDEIKRLGDEIKRLAARVKEFKSLREELKKQFEENL